MQSRLVVFALLLLGTPFAALAATGTTPATPSTDLARAAGNRAEVQAPAGAPQRPSPARSGALAPATARLAPAPLLDLVAHPGVAQAGCGSFTRCVTVADCPCEAPDCACVPSSTCGFQICLCRTYCFGGDPP